MISKFIRAILRVIFHVARLLLRLIEAVIPRLYMVFYLRLLRAYGLKLNGKPRYISTKVRFDDFNKVELGERVVISENVILLTHDYSLTTGLIAIDKPPLTDMAFLRPISIGNNVFVGMGAIIMPGTKIHDNVIIGAGSVVRGDVPSDSIVLGNPGVVVGSLTEKAIQWEKLSGDIDILVD